MLCPLQWHECSGGAILQQYGRSGDVFLRWHERSGDAFPSVARVPRHDKLTLAVAGSVGDAASACKAAGFDACFSICRGPSSLAEAMDPAGASQNLTATVEQVFRLLRGLQRRNF